MLFEQCANVIDPCLLLVITVFKLVFPVKIYPNYFCYIH